MNKFRKSGSKSSFNKENCSKNAIQTKVESNDSKIGPFIIEKEIGRGTFSSVLKLKRPDITKRSFACKVIKKSELEKDIGAKISFEREVRINHQLHHPGHAELLDLIYDDNNYYMIMEYCSGGSLFKYIQKHEGPLQEEEAKPLFKQIIETLSYIQKMGVSHRDIKPENILFNRYHKLVLIDFGFSRFVEHSSQRRNLVRSRCGSTEYASPEVLTNSKDPYDGFASDVWSCGVVLYFMISKRLPWEKSSSSLNTIKQIRNGEFKIPPNISESCKDLLQKILTVSPHKRISVPQILDHPWLKDVPAQFDLKKETIYNAISLKMVDNFLGYDDSSENPRNNLKIYRSNSMENLNFDQLQINLTKSYCNELPVLQEDANHKLSKNKSWVKIHRSPNSNYVKKTSENPSFQLGTPVSKQHRNMNLNQSPMNQLLSSQNIQPLIKESAKAHIVRPPESNKPRLAARGRHQQRLLPLKELDNSMDFLPQPPNILSPKAPRSFRRPINCNM